MAGSSTGHPQLPTEQTVVVFERGGWSAYPISACDRASWQQQGWTAAFALVDAAMTSDSQPRIVSMPEALPVPSSNGAVVEHYPPVVSDVTLSSAALFEAVERCGRQYASQGVEFHIAVSEVGDLACGWYAQTGKLTIPKGKDELEQELSVLLPVAFGRAGFDVGASVVASVSIDSELGAAVDYMERIWIGGLAIGDLEGYGSDMGWTTRGHYAVLSAFHDLVGIDSSRRLAVGAVSWAGL